MIKNITIGQFIPGDTPIHNIDPRIKILLAMSMITILFFITNFWGYLVYALFVVLIIFLSKVPFKIIARGLRPLLAIIIITIVINMFMTQGERLFSIWRLTITREGLMMAGLMGLRLIFLITGASLLTLTTSPIALTDGIEKLLNPFKKIGIPAHELAMMMTIALRFIPTLLEETDKIMKAQMARGADFETGNLIARAKAMVPLLVPLFISAFRRADELALAMEARCYRGGENRTRMKQLKLTMLDFYSAAAIIVFCAIIIFVR